MKTEEMRIAIAEACGWTYDHNKFKAEAADVALWTFGDAPHHSVLPDFCNDLNAMHEAEKTLEPTKISVHGSQEWAKYVGELANIVGHRHSCIHATAAQRAEAFLKVKGLWKE